MQHIVVETEKHARKAIQLFETKWIWTSDFLPINVIKGRNARTVTD